MKLPPLHELTQDTLTGSYLTVFGIVSVLKFLESDAKMKVRGYNPFTRRSFLLLVNDEGRFMRSTQTDNAWWGDWEQLA